ncbi:MAG: zinc-ribbon domain-containing protein [Rickettsiaceae bacterium]
MYISCPKCQTKFVVKSEQIGTYGRKVKCSKCANIWHQKLESQLRIEPIFTDHVVSQDTKLGNGVNLPALLPVKIPTYLYTMPLVMIGLIVFMCVMLFPKQLNVNSLLNSNELSIKDIQIQNEQDLNKITVSYKVHNNSNNKVKMPLVRIRLFDKDNRVIKSLVDDHTNIEMAANQFIQIKTEFAPAPKSTRNIDIMIGNKIDFIIR